MVSSVNIRAWAWVHKWSSLISTAFLLFLCVTGLPLVFTEEIFDWTNPPPAYAQLPANVPRANLDHLAAKSRQMYPGQIITSLFVDDDEPKVVVTMAASWKDLKRPGADHWIKFDARTGQVVEESHSKRKQGQPIIVLIRKLHADLLMGLAGELFLGLMGLLFVIAIVSGVMLYSPFMRRMPFGTVRVQRSRRAHWLDLHNLLGIVATAWMVVVGLTGVVNELSAPMFATWRANTVNQMIAPWLGKPPIEQAEFASIDNAFKTAQRALPDMSVISAIYPGSTIGTPHHYFIWTHGKSPLTSQLLTPVLVDARTGDLTAVVPMPWYLRILELSRPLHFGDYGGAPLKIIWALLDVITIIVLGSGLYLWFARTRRERKEFPRQGLHLSSHALEPAE